MKALIIASLLLTGCEAGGKDIKTKTPVFGSYASMGHITTDNGMPCIIYENIKRGGITCDWDFKSRAKPIKFYTVPGYDCETGPIAGHCTKWNITQAAYDKDFFKEAGQ